MLKDPLRDKQEDAPVFYCDKCGGEIYEYEIYGECDGEIVCACCADAEWASLWVDEKLDKLGYNVKLARFVKDPRHG